MGDLVVGARSGSGEPEGRDTPAGKARPETDNEASGTADDPVAEDGGTSLDKRADGPEGAQGTTADSGLPPNDSAGGDAGDGGGIADEKKPGDGAPADDDEKKAEDGEDGKDKDEKKQRSFWKELPILIGIALVLALLIKTFFVQAFSIPSDSMQNTLQRGDRVLVDKFTPWFGAKPQRGEVVVFHDPGGWLNEQTVKTNAFQDVLSWVGLMPSAKEKDLIKRVIAVGGDTVECSGSGPVKVNGKPLKEPYVYPGATPCSDQPFGPVKVPEGRLWVMGDHRNDSLDSRYHQSLPGNGTIDEDQVVGRAFVVAWPMDRWSTLPVPGTFDQPGLAADGAAPAALGLVGAVPLTLLNRRRVIRKAVRKAARRAGSGAGR